MEDENILKIQEECFEDIINEIFSDVQEKLSNILNKNNEKFLQITGRIRTDEEMKQLKDYIISKIRIRQEKKQQLKEE